MSEINAWPYALVFMAGASLSGAVFTALRRLYLAAGVNALLGLCALLAAYVQVR